MERKEKSLAQIRFELRHDVWIKADYQGPIITPDGDENKYAIFRRSEIKGFTNWFDGKLANNPRYYRKPTDKEIDVLAKIEYDRLSKIESAPTTVENKKQEASNKNGNTIGLEGAVNYFTKEGEHWYIGFEGKTAIVKKLDGLLYIGYLLEKPGKQIPCRDLYQAASGRMPDKIMAEGSAIEEGLNIGNSQQAVSSPEAKAEYMRQYKKLNDELLRINDLPNYERTPEHEMEKKDIEEELGKIILIMKEKTFADPNNKKAQANMTKRLQTAYKALDKAGMKELETHLRKHIRPDDAYGLIYNGSHIWNITL